MSDTRAAIAELERLSREIEVGCDALEPERIEVAIATREQLLRRWHEDPALASDPRLRAFVAAQGAELTERLRAFQRGSNEQLARIVRAGEIRRGYVRRDSDEPAASALDRSG